MKERTCDVAIVTALPVEREAVVRRLQGPERVRVGGEPLAYHFGELPGKTRPIRVVVAELPDMGNPDAAIAATKMIERWRPSLMLMVGIGGGVRGRVDWGDVAVSEYAYYYEPSKVFKKVTEIRGRQYPSDALLYSRAKDYEASEWKDQINVPRPGISPGNGAIPKALFGPIACGEQVVASDTEIKKLKGQCPKMIALAMEGAGVAKAVLSSGQQIRYLEIRGISDLAGPDKNDNWREYAADAAAAFSIGFLRSGIVEEVREAGRSPMGGGRDLLMVAAQSLRRIPEDEILPALRAGGDDRRPGFISLDFTDLVKNKILADPGAAAARICDPHGALMEALATQANLDWAFQGLASIPLVVLAGHVVSDRRPVRLFDYHPELESWSWPGPSTGHPELILKRTPDTPAPNAVEATLRVTVSYGVSHDLIDATHLKEVPRIDLALEAPARSVVRSEEQTRNYGRVLRRALDSLARLVPKCERVHLFYAGPMALAFHIGQQISETMHPRVIAWNYQKERGYEWGIDLAAAVVNKPCIVRPGGPTGGAR